MDNKFLTRSFFSILLISLVFCAVYILPLWIFCVILSGFIALGLYDFFNMVENKGIFVYKYFGIVVGALLPIVIFIGNGLPEFKNFEPLFIVVASLFAFILQFVRRENAQDRLVSMALTLFSLLYISWFLSFIMRIRFLDNGGNLVAFLIIVTKSADIGAYLVGSRFGKNELIPRISPKKTKEGTVGGILVSMILAVIAGRFLTGFSYLHLCMLGIILATLGQVGDLAESLIKRDCNVKDSGIYLKGIGGALDVVDSLLFTAPVFYFYIKTF